MPKTTIHPATPTTRRPAPPRGRTSPQRTTTPSGAVARRGCLIVLTGPAGYGKSSLAAQFPKKMQCIFDQFDQGLSDLVGYGRIKDYDQIILPEEDEIITHDSEGWDTLMKLNARLWSYYKECDPHDGSLPRSILMENMKGMETACFKYHCRTDYGANWDKFMTYSNGPKSAVSTEWVRLLDYVNLYRSLGIHVIMTGHTEVKEKKSAEYDHPVSVASTTTYLFDATIKDANLVMQMGLDYEVTRKGTGDFQQVRASKNSHTKLICNRSPIYGSCKNHFGITDEIIITGGPEETYNDLCKAAGLNPETFKPY